MIKILAILLVAFFAEYMQACKLKEAFLRLNSEIGSRSSYRESYPVPVNYNPPSSYSNSYSDQPSYYQIFNPPSYSYSLPREPYSEYNSNFPPPQQYVSYSPPGELPYFVSGYSDLPPSPQYVSQQNVPYPPQPYSLPNYPPQYSPQRYSPQVPADAYYPTYIIHTQSSSSNAHSAQENIVRPAPTPQDLNLAPVIFYNTTGAATQKPSTAEQSRDTAVPQNKNEPCHASKSPCERPTCRDPCEAKNCPYGQVCYVEPSGTGCGGEALCRNPCDLIRCPAPDEFCYTEISVCIKTPCNPIAVCKNPCSGVLCGPAERCELEEDYCIKPPCSPVGVCKRY